MACVMSVNKRLTTGKRHVQVLEPYNLHEQTTTLFTIFK
jgi:hypothetical protein